MLAMVSKHPFPAWRSVATCLYLWSRKMIIKAAFSIQSLLHTAFTCCILIGWIMWWCWWGTRVFFWAALRRGVQKRRKLSRALGSARRNSFHWQHFKEEEEEEEEGDNPPDVSRPDPPAPTRIYSQRQDGRFSRRVLIGSASRDAKWWHGEDFSIWQKTLRRLEYFLPTQTQQQKT